MSSQLRIENDRTIRLTEGSGARLAAGPGPVMLVGDLALLDFSDLLNLILQSRLSGVLRISSDSSNRILTFDDGEFRGVSSSRVGERLSEVMVRMGFVKREVMEQLVEESGPGRRIGRVVVERGLLTERDLWNVIQEQVTSIFQSLIVEAAGVFTFSEGAVESSITVPGLSVEGLLMEGLRRIDEMNAPSPQDLRARLERILASYNEAFRDIFATASEAGSRDAVLRASRSAFAGDAFQAAIFEGVTFTAAGEVPERAFLGRFEEGTRGSSDNPEELLRDILSKAMLFLLFVTGEHLERDVQRALHDRTKSTIELRGVNRLA